MRYSKYVKTGRALELTGRGIEAAGRGIEAAGKGLTYPVRKPLELAGKGIAKVTVKGIKASERRFVNRQIKELETFAKYTKPKDLEDLIFKPTAMRKMAEATTNKLPGAKYFWKMVNPTYGITDDIGRASVARAYSQVMVEGRLNVELAQFARYDIKKMLGVVGDSSMTKWNIAEGDLIQHIEKYAKEKGIPDETRDICTGLRDTVAKWEKFMEEAGVVIKKVKVPEGGFFPRYAITKDGVEITTKYGTVNLSGKSSLFNSRWHEEMVEGIANNVGYLNDPAVITSIYCRAAANSALDRIIVKTANEAKYTQTAKQLLGKKIIDNLDSARRFRNDQTYVDTILKRMQRGESPSGFTMQGLERIDPSLSKIIKEITQATANKKIALRQIERELKSFPGIEPQKGIAEIRAIIARAKRGEQLTQTMLEKVDAWSPSIGTKLGDALNIISRQKQKLITLGAKQSEILNTAYAKFNEARYAYQHGMAGIKANPKLQELTGIFQGQYANPEVTQQITKYFGQKKGADYRFAKGFNDYLNRMVRFAQTGFDFGVGHLQLLPMLIIRPDWWVKAQLRSLQFMFNPRAQAEFISRPENAKIFLEMSEKAFMELGIQAAEMVQVGGKAGRTLMNIPPAKAFQRQFGAAIDMAKFYTYKGLKDLARGDPQKLKEIGGFIDKLYGTLNTSKLGISPLASELETMLLYAPRYLRAYLGLFTDMFQGGLKGQMARTAFASVLTGMYAEYSALHKGFEYIGWIDEPLSKENLDPRTGKLLTFKFNEKAPWGLRGRYVGLGSNWVSLFLRLPASIYKQATENPEKLIKLRDIQDNALLKALRSKSSVFMGGVWDVLTKRDYLGQYLGIPENAAREFMDTITPFWLDFKAEDTSFLSMIEGIPSEMAGWRTWVQPQYEKNMKIADEATARVCEKYGLDKMTYEEAQKSNNWVTMKVKEENPDLVKLFDQSWQDYARNYPNDPGVKAQLEIQGHKNTWLAERMANEKLLMEGKITVEEWRKRRATSAHDYSLLVDKVQKQYAEVFAEWDKQREIPELSFNIAYYDYIARVIAPEFKDETGKFSYEQRDAAIKEFKEAYGNMGEDYYNKIQQIFEYDRTYSEWEKSSIILQDRLKEYWAIPPEQKHKRNVWLKEHPSEEAALVILGYRDLPKNKEADDYLDNIMVLTGLPPAAIWGAGTTEEIYKQFIEYSRLEGTETLSAADEKKLYRERHGPFNTWLEDVMRKSLLNPAEQLVLDWDFSIPQDEALEKLNAYYKIPGFSTDIGKIHREEKRRTDFLLDASLCIVGEEKRPLTDAGWDALSKLLPLNDLTWDDLYKEGANDVIDYIKVYYSLPEGTEREAYRYAYQQLDAWGIRNGYFTSPIMDRTLKEKNKYTRIAKEKGWRKE